MKRILMLGSLALLMGGAGQTSALAKVVSFVGGPDGGVPYDFEPMQTGGGKPGEWKVVEDGSAPGGRALDQTSQDPTDGRFPVLVQSAGAPADVSVATRIKPISGRVDQAGGLVVRLQDANNYYVVRANALEGNVRFYKVTGGKREQLGGADLPVTANAWHDLRLDAQGDRFTVSFDGRELFTTVDATMAAPGKVGFWTKADSVTRFDALSVRPLP
ncbi:MULTISPECIES: LamG domain-containing protein [Methylobacteriaceae]|uniref:LamG domain-containing protein n=1 Tax=Methylobacteriaceae TaxID=119045 RepID=UPI001FEF045C|nr:MULTISPECIES: LamG domain-containing protein [Methylobacteriaceae]